jgi:predicted  nucleic acid-binding Zn-ribbon protein
MRSAGPVNDCCLQDSAPVWQQLRQLCDKSPLCAPARLQAVNREQQLLRAEVAALQKHNVELQEGHREVQQLRNKVAAVQMQNEDLQEKITELQQYRTEVAALQQRNAQLEQQVVQLQGQRQGHEEGEAGCRAVLQRVRGRRHEPTECGFVVTWPS